MGQVVWEGEEDVWTMQPKELSEMVKRGMLSDSRNQLENGETAACFANSEPAMLADINMSQVAVFFPKIKYFTHFLRDTHPPPIGFQFGFHLGNLGNLRNLKHQRTYI